MPIKKIVICDVCGKQEDFYDALHGGSYGMSEKWYMVNICHTVCSSKCYHKEFLPCIIDKDPRK